jgi:hypothetical protein
MREKLYGKGSMHGDGSMTSLFHDGKIRKYFPCVHGNPQGSHNIIFPDCTGIDTKAVLKAMCEPIKESELYIALFPHGAYLNSESHSKGSERLQCYRWQREDWHPNYLRLPDKFQKPVDPVEEAARKLSSLILHPSISDGEFSEELIKFFRLAKETK